MRKAAPEPGFWDIEQTAAYLGSTAPTVRYWVWAGTGPRSFKIGRRRMFKPTDVKSWAERRASEPRPS